MQHYEPEYHVQKSVCCLQGQGHSEGLCQTFCYQTWCVMHHHELECHAKRFVGYFQGQGCSKGSYDQNMTVSIF